MRFTKVDFRNPANSMLAAVHNYCFALVKSPEENGITELGTLKHKVTVFIDQQTPNYSKCKLELRCEVHSYQTFQIFNLLHGEDKISIQLCSRRTEYEQPFEEYDNGRISYKWPVSQFK